MVFLLNNDVTFEKDFLFPLAEFLGRKGKWAAVSPLVKDFSGEIWHPGGRLRRFWARVEPMEKPKSVSESYEVEILPGCAVLFNAAALREIGLFDEDFFLCFEDVDWWLRARRKGFSLNVIPRSIVHHKISQSLGGQTSPMATYYLLRNNLLLVRKYYRGLAKIPPHLYLFALSLKMVFNLFSRKIPQKGACLKAIVWAWQDYFLKRFGKCCNNNLIKR